MRNVHRVFLPSLHNKEDGVIADTTYVLEGDEVVAKHFIIRLIMDGKIGRDISNTIDKTTYYAILMHSLNEIRDITKNGSEY